MFRFIFALLLLNSSYRSLGVPIPSSTPVSLVNLLTALSNSCENRFLSDQIKNKLVYCSDLSSPHGEKQLECLIFYDINKQLCAAVGASKLALTEDYTAKINEEQDVNVLCGTTKDWVFTNITEYTRYKSSVEKVFKHPVTCGKVCGVEELMSDDSNFFCKYFKWGTDMLKIQIAPATQEDALQMPSGTGIVESKSVISPSSDLDVQIKNSTTLNAPNAPLEAASVKTEGTTKTEAVKQEASSENNQELEQLSANSAPSEKSEPKTVKEPLAAEEPVVPSSQADKPMELTSPELNEAQKPESPDSTLTKPDSEDSQKSEVDKEIRLLNNELERKEPVETPGQSKGKQPSDVDDYQDSDDSKDGLGDIQGDDDGDDAMIGDINKINKPDDPKEEPKESQDVKTIVSGITGETGLYPSFGQDSYDDDDDDHFFSFFLTAVIMVVLIYVLYHNKNKVGKVFFGLILEGRQSGRRRNSRGHAYRRLDTLEQAMSTNTAAPPSKIIY